jgi:hypothetical protein
VYLSIDLVKDAADVPLTGKRSVKEVAAGEILPPAGRSYTVPLATAPGTYYVLVCGDITNRVPESDESNNCKIAATRLIVY